VLTEDLRRRLPHRYRAVGIPVGVDRRTAVAQPHDATTSDPRTEANPRTRGRRPKPRRSPEDSADVSVPQQRLGGPHPGFKGRRRHRRRLRRALSLGSAPKPTGRASHRAQPVRTCKCASRRRLRRATIPSDPARVAWARWAGVQGVSRCRRVRHRTEETPSHFLVMGLFIGGRLLPVADRCPLGAALARIPSGGAQAACGGAAAG
jgi:hypothetical protein